MPKPISKKPFIICVDDDQPLLQSLRQELYEGVGASYKIEIADSGEDGLELIEELLDTQSPIALVISDQLMPGMKGDEFLISTHQVVPTAKKILLTGQAAAEAIGRAVNEAALYRFISKPWDPKDLILTVRQALKSWESDLIIEQNFTILRLLNRFSSQLSGELQVDKWIASFSQLIIRELAIPQCWFWLHEQGTTTGASATVGFEARDGQLSKLSPETGSKLFSTLGSTPCAWLEPYASHWQGKLVLNDRHLASLVLADPDSKFRFTGTTEKCLEALCTQMPVYLANALQNENQEALIAERTRELAERNEDLTDSIQYARRIQHALLPRPQSLQRIASQYGLLYHPRDIVSGDLYWSTTIHTKQYLAVIDCTGHGVPGAFMAVLANTLLNQAVQEVGDSAPNTWLNWLHKAVTTALQQTGEASQGTLTRTTGQTVLDGMDVALICLEPDGRLTWASANRPIWLWQAASHDWQDFAFDRLSVGGRSLAESLSNHGHTEQQRAFTDYQTHIAPNDRLYLFTDGLTDQFGGEHERKLTAKRFREILTETVALPVGEQIRAVEHQIKAWQGNQRQTDDWLLIGLQK
jgi:serine phosphatase RsbU (regulator of sigma subunit)/FixJ family two-component response regulator